MNPQEARLGTQIISVADSYDSLMSGVDGKRRGRAAALTSLRSEVGTRYRAEVVEALAALVAARSDGGQQRRQTDRQARQRGAA